MRAITAPAAHQIVQVAPLNVDAAAACWADTVDTSSAVASQGDEPNIAPAEFVDPYAVTYDSFQYAAHRLLWTRADQYAEEFEQPNANVILTFVGVAAMAREGKSVLGFSNTRGLVPQHIGDCRELLQELDEAAAAQRRK